MTTKERIVDEALTLFSINGYHGTSVKNIADAVGIKDSSLYKHFKSKQEILDTIVVSVRNHIEEMSNEYGLPTGTDYKEAAVIYAAMDEDSFVEFCKKVFLLYLKDSYLSRFWRMGNMEQYKNQTVYELFRKLFLEDSLVYQTALFEEMRKQQIFTDADPQVMAMSFYTPIYFLLSKYSNCPEKEKEALAILEKQLREFSRVYKK